MLHISFAMTVEAFTDCTKTETRRFWTVSHAKKFKPGTLFMGITKDFRAGGQRIHPAKVVFCHKERLGDMTEESFLREGGTRYWSSREDYIQAMGGDNLEPFVIRFEHLSAKHEPVTTDLFPEWQINCYYCGEDPGETRPYIWNGFFDKDMKVNVCWNCAVKHYIKKQQTEFANMYSEVPVMRQFS